MTHQPKIAILLATYNSEKFLREQIDSLLSQRYQNFVIYARDDGSTDRTITILGEYPNITIMDDPQHNRGAKYSFMWLLANTEADYYMFCDHDDVWNIDKIEVTLKKMREIEADNPPAPAVVCSDLEVVDQDLNTLHPSMWQYSKICPHILNSYNYLSVCNIFTGCTMMINQSAKEISLPISHHATMHDYWIALKVASIGGGLGYVECATIKYRQHGGNVVGAHAVEKNYIINKLKSIKRVIHANQETLAMLRDIKNINLISYIFYKLLYLLKR